MGCWNDYMICVCAPHPTFYHSFVPLRITSTRDTENTAATTVYATRILEDSLTSKLYADLALISSCCYTAADYRWPQKGQTNPRRGHAGACSSIAADDLPMFQPCLQKWDRSVITGRGGIQNGRRGVRQVLPLQKKGRGAEKVLAMLKGGVQKFQGTCSFNSGYLGSFSHAEVGRKKF